MNFMMKSRNLMIFIVIIFCAKNCQCDLLRIEGYMNPVDEPMQKTEPKQMNGQILVSYYPTACPPGHKKIMGSCRPIKNIG